MTKEKLWTIYVEKNPHFLTGPINFTPDGLKKFFDQTWKQASKQTPSYASNNPLPKDEASLENWFSDLLNKSGKK